MKRMDLGSLPRHKDDTLWLNEDIESISVEDADIYFEEDYTELYKLHITRSRFIDSFENRHLVKVQFFNCDFSNMKFDASTLKDVEFNNCNLTGTEFINLNMNSVLFFECKMMLNNFVKCKFTDIHFENIQFNHLFLNDVQIKSVTFDECLVDEFDIFDTSLKNVDLSSFEIGLFNVQKEDLEGAFISESQAVKFIELFGMKVKRE